MGKNMIEKAPELFKDKIFHHGKLSKSNMKNLENCLIIVDEIDTGDKEYQKLHCELMDAGLLDIEHMKKHNNRFVFISATLIRELRELYKWGDLHIQYKMTIPESYIGHSDLLEKGIIKEYYSLQTKELANKWIQEDILENYGNDFRIHIVRVKKNINVLQQSCIENGIIFKNHTSEKRISQEELKNIFISDINNHIVIGIKGFFRRANLIPNDWKIRIGATHELYTKKVDYNVQIQGLPGRMTGYWRDIIERGHKTGPYRTSTKAVKDYEANYNDPNSKNDYKTMGYTKNKRCISTTISTFLQPKHIKHLIPIEPDYQLDSNKNMIPVKVEINDSELLKELVELRTQSKRGYKLIFHSLLVKGICNGSILLYDNNNHNKFENLIESRKVKVVRMYKEGDKKEVRRFKNFNDAFESFKTTSQTSDKTEYNVDFAKDKYEFNDFVNETNIFWITFRT